MAEQEWNEWVIARSRVGEVLTPDDDAAGAEASKNVPDAGGQPVRPDTPEGAQPNSLVPMWREGLAWSGRRAEPRR